MNQSFKLIIPLILVLLISSTSHNANSEGRRNWASQGFASDNDYSPSSTTSLEKYIDVTAVLPNSDQTPVSSFRGYSQEKCVTCHDGIEEVSASHPKEFGCTVCHGGIGSSANKEEAHSTLIFDPNLGSGKGNPSALATANLSCGQAQCHSGHEQEDKNHIQRVRKSIMATMAGVISNLRYQWGGQTEKKSKYGAFEVADEDGKVPEKWGALRGLASLPFFSISDLPRESEVKTDIVSNKLSNHIGDGVIRNKCFKCHLGAASSNRSHGCANCHFSRAKDNLYKGNDPVIDKTEPGHISYHKMVALPERNGCLQCHTSFSLNIDQINTTSQNNKNHSIELPGSGKAKEDIHFQAGFECIDCHTQFDIMGDGNIYSSQFQAVEIRCETCHGTAESGPSVAQIAHPDDRAIRLSRHYKGFLNKPGDWMAVSARGRKLTNVKAIGGKLITFEKRTGKKHPTPLVRKGNKAHFISGHKRLGCTACHSQWSPLCNECSIVYNQSKLKKDESNKHLNEKISEPVLILGPRGKIVTMTARYSHNFTALDEKEHLVEAINKDGDSLGPYRKWGFTNPMGYSGSNTNLAFQPHSVSKQVRSCESCHLSSTALGLGEGEILIGKNSTGKYDKMMPLNRTNLVSGVSKLDPKATVTLRGEKIAGSGQPGVRPLNQKEITRVLKIGNCIPCHGSYGDKIYKNISKSYKFEKTVGHRKLRKKIIR